MWLVPWMLTWAEHWVPIPDSSLLECEHPTCEHRLARLPSVLPEPPPLSCGTTTTTCHPNSYTTRPEITSWRVANHSQSSWRESMCQLLALVGFPLWRLEFHIFALLLWFQFDFACSKSMFGPLLTEYPYSIIFQHQLQKFYSLLSFPYYEQQIKTLITFKNLQYSINYKRNLQVFLTKKHPNFHCMALALQSSPSFFLVVASLSVYPLCLGLRRPSYLVPESLLLPPDPLPSPLALVSDPPLAFFTNLPVPALDLVSVPPAGLLPPSSIAVASLSPPPVSVPPPPLSIAVPSLPPPAPLPLLATFSGANRFALAAPMVEWVRPISLAISSSFCSKESRRALYSAVSPNGTSQTPGKSAWNNEFPNQGVWKRNDLTLWIFKKLRNSCLWSWRGRFPDRRLCPGNSPWHRAWPDPPSPDRSTPDPLPPDAKISFSYERSKCTPCLVKSKHGSITKAKFWTTDWRPLYLMKNELTPYCGTA